MTDLRGLRIGYVPYSPDLAYAGDRRRFCHYAERRNLRFEIARPSETYDLVVLTERADLSVWSTYSKGNAKVVYSLINPYLAVPRLDPRALLRGAAKFVTRQSRRLQLNHRKAIQAMCRRADAVVCTTEEQRQDILPYCCNVHIIVDIHSAVVRTLKQQYAAGEPFNLVWEGLPENIEAFFEIRDVLEQLQRAHALALHLVTDLEYGRYMRKYGKRYTTHLARRVLDRTYLYQWNAQLCSAIITACDLALIPIALDQPLDAGKPENKLLLFWRMGMPTVVSATPAYSRAMERAGLNMACRTAADWLGTLEHYLTDEAARRDAGQRGKAFVEQQYGEERLLARWDDLFASVLADAR